MKESELLKIAMLKYSKRGFRLFRNNVGLFTPYHQVKSALAAGNLSMLRDARPIHCGLFVGSGDLIGWRPVTITPDMVGSTIAQIASIETKTLTGSVRPEQENWMKQVNDSGGYAVICRPDDDALC